MNNISNSINLASVANNNLAGKTSKKDSTPQEASCQKEIDCSSSDIYKKNPMYNVSFKGQMAQQQYEKEANDANVQLNIATKALEKHPALKVLIDTDADSVKAPKADTIGKTVYNISCKLVEDAKLSENSEDQQLIAKEIAAGFIIGLYQALCGTEPNGVKHLGVIENAVKANDIATINKEAQVVLNQMKGAIFNDPEAMKNTFKRMSPEEKAALSNIVIE